MLSNTSNCSGSNHHTSSYVTNNQNNNNDNYSENLKLLNGCPFKTNEDQGKNICSKKLLKIKFNHKQYGKCSLKLKISSNIVQ